MYDSSALNNIRNAVKKLFEQKHAGILCWTASSTHHLTFEEISGICRNYVPSPEIYEKLEYHIYDIIPSHKKDMDYVDRLELLTKTFKNELNNPFLKIVPSVRVESVDDVHECHGKFTSSGYEGTMIRNRLGAYAHNRSYNLQKFKDFEENEFLIVDVKEATGNDEGTAIIQCSTAKNNSHGDLFWVRPKGRGLTARVCWNHK